MPIPRWIFFCHAFVYAALFFSPILHGEVNAVLPLGGYYHPGRFIPVRIVCKSPPSTLQLSGDGTVPTIINDPHTGEFIVPFLAGPGPLRGLSISGATTLELKPIPDHERLIVIADADADSAKAIFPTDTLIPIPLELTHALLEPALAWTGIDAVVLSPAARARLSDSQISTLLSGGVALIVIAAEPPDTHWPWQHVGNLWVLRHNVAGPQDLVRTEAYTPTYAWDRGLPPAMRRQIVLVAAIFGILTLGLSLCRFRHATLVFLGLCAVTIALIWIAYLRQPVELFMTKTIAVDDHELTQMDHWTWRATLRESHFTQRPSQYTVPLFASFRQIDSSEMRLMCDSLGRPISYNFRLAPDQSIAFLTRDLQPFHPMPASYSPTEPLWNDFTHDLYLTQVDRLAGDARILSGAPATIINRTNVSHKSD